MATHSSTLAWKIPWAEEPGRLQSMGSWRVGHNWATSLSLFSFMHSRRNGNPPQCSCLENPRDREPDGLPSMGSHRVRHDWSDLAAEAAAGMIDDYISFVCVCVCVKSIVMMLYWDNLGYARCFNFKGIHSCFSLILILDYHPSSCIERWAQISCLSFLLIRREVTFFGCLPS